MRLVYNGIDLGLLQLHQFEGEAVYDSLAATDYLFTKYAVAVSAVVNGTAELVTDTSLGADAPVSYVFSDLPAGAAPDANATPPTGSSFYREQQSPSPLAANGSNPPAVTSTRKGELQSPDPSNLGVFNGSAGIAADTKRVGRAVTKTPARAGLTYATIRHRLTTPRGKLWVFADDGTVLLSSPDIGSVCDCKNGPTPKLLSIDQAFGDGESFVVTWVCETYVNEGKQNSAFANGPLLSNRFRQTHEMSNDCYLTVHTEGEVVFRTDWVYKLPQSPDSKRPMLFQPIPQGFQRENIVVEGLPGVEGVRYAYADVEQHLNFPAGRFVNAVSIEAVHRQVIHTGSDSYIDSALNLYERRLGQRVNQQFAREPEPSQRGQKRRRRRPPQPPTP